jgi:threonine/homoserine/homoserine lactone efflux protein
MSLLCMRRTLAAGWRHGLATGGGIAVGDACYAAVAALGLAGVSSFMLAHERPLHLLAGAFLLWLGLKTWKLRVPAEGPAPVGGTGSWPASFASAVLLTLTNPPTIIMFAAILTALAPPTGLDPAAGAATVAGVFAGSALWWCGVVALVSALRHGIGGGARTWIDRLAGIALCVFGVAELRRAW